MNKLGTRCPRCDAIVLGTMRYCGKCGWDMKEPYWKESTEEEASAAAVRPTETARTETPKPTETARVASPSETGHIRYREYEEYGERREKLTVIDKALEFFARMSRADRIKLIAASAAAVVIIIVAICLIARMNRKPAEPEISRPVETMHVIEAPTPTPTLTPAPTFTPPPTLPPATAAPTATPGWDISEVSGVIYALTDYVKIYAGPGTDYEVIATVYRGDELTRTGVLDGWTRVDINGQEGFIAHGDISMSKPQPTPTPTPLVPDFEVEERDDMVTVDSGANLRIGPGKEYDVVDSVGGGSQLHRTGVVGAWSQVEYDGYRVYVYTELLRGEGPTPTPAPTEAPAPAPTDAPAPVEPDSGYSGGTITMYQNGNVRTGPGTDYESLGIAPGGTSYEVTGKSGDWYIINFNGRTGYVYEGLVE